MMANKLIAVVLVTMVATVASNTCYKCTSTQYEVDEAENPTVAALFRGLTAPETADCADNPTAVLECGENVPCALVRKAVEYKLTNQDGSVETGKILDRVARFCSRVPSSELPDGCYDFPLSMDSYLGHLRNRLEGELGQPYNGAIEVVDIKGKWCQACCGDNSNGWTDITIE